ncbi:MAG: precorrin-3B synthase [Proteobacteria bacterium]|nr:precorrin-3B synthase [Pseudomonadota bacterium]
MSGGVAPAVKGWCPGALRPMESGDGLVARVRPWIGAFTLTQASALADIAERLGNGHLELTRRANLQIRGLRQEALPELHAALNALGLLDRDVATEAARNIMVAPLAGLDAGAVDIRPLARELTAILAADRQLAALPAKFGWLVDGGGIASIAGERADIALCARGDRVALRLDTRWVGIGTPDQAMAAALSAARAFLALGACNRMRKLSDAHWRAVRAAMVPALSPIDDIELGRTRPLGLLPAATGLAAPFGEIDVAQLRGVVALAAGAGASELRLSPWRILYIGARGDRRLLDAASDLGLIVDPADPLLRVDACPGAPSCNAATVDSRAAARWLAAHGATGTVHVSGCAKGCARSAPADLVLVGEAGRYHVVRRGTTHDIPEGTIQSNELRAVLHG